MDAYKIVLADDHALFRQGLRRLIEDVAELEVVGEACDGMELLKLLDAIVPDMVILDISMPNLRGLEAIGKVKMKCPDAKVLILSMHREYIYHAMSAGADGYLLKEDADRELFSAIDNIREGRVFLSPRCAGDLIGSRVQSLDPLSGREKEVLKLIAGGKANKEIADILFISIRTVETHRANIMTKTKLKNTADLVRYAIQRGYA
jgi:DNA-binding NarL/FixJ family response regulator